MPFLASLPGLRPYLLSVRFCQRVSKPTHISIIIVSSAKLQRPASVCKQTQLDIHSTKKMTFNSILLENTLLCTHSERPTSPLQWWVEVEAIVLSYQNTLDPRKWHAAIISKEMCVHKIYSWAHRSGPFLWFLHLMDQLATLRRLWERMGTKKKYCRAKGSSCIFISRCYWRKFYRSM